MKKKLLPQSGAAPYLMTETGPRVMLVTNSAGTGWILPKGNIPHGCGRIESAGKEAFEEAGVTGVCEENLLGVCRSEKSSGGAAVIPIYPMRIESVLPEWREQDRRTRRLFRLKDALRLMPDEPSREVIRNLEKLLDPEGITEHGN